jgi:hypothetical protein
MQALHLQALAPVDETTADKNSYGFRPNAPPLTPLSSASSTGQRQFGAVGTGRRHQRLLKSVAGDLSALLTIIAGSESGSLRKSCAKWLGLV